MRWPHSGHLIFQSYVFQNLNVCAVRSEGKDDFQSLFGADQLQGGVNIFVWKNMRIEIFGIDLA